MNPTLRKLTLRGRGDRGWQTGLPEFKSQLCDPSTGCMLVGRSLTPLGLRPPLYNGVNSSHPTEPQFIQPTDVKAAEGAWHEGMYSVGPSNYHYYYYQSNYSGNGR